MREDSGYRQAEVVSALAQEAFRHGADWILPFDADEFWTPIGTSLPRLLRGSVADVLHAPVQNFVQRRDVVQSGADALLTMTRRVGEPVGPLERTRALVEAREIAFVEMLYPPKVIARAGPDIHIELGNHAVKGTSGSVAATDAVVCLHAPLRSREALARKAENGRRSDAAGHAPGLNWHLRRWALMTSAELDAEWRANSYDGAGCLDVYGKRRPLVQDTALAEAVREVV